MSDLMINLDTATLPLPTKKRSEAGNTKHQRFVKRRRFLERKGFLKQKQLPSQTPCPKRDASHGRTVVADRGKKRQKVDRPEGPAHQGGHIFHLDASTCRTKVPPRESCSRCPTDTQLAPPPKGPSDKGGGAPPRQNGALLPTCSLRDIPRITLCSAFESSLPSGSPKPTKTVAIDCEMVGTGPGGRNSDLARCSVVGYEGDVIYDKYIRPPSPITNYRTRWSGIRRHHMANAVPFKVAQKEILRLLSGKIVVGHAIHNDFKALKYFHPKALTRDTSKIPLLNRKAGFPENEAASLKRLTKQLLHRDIQVGQNGHSSVEDARATMELYRVVEDEWESLLATAPAQD